MNNHPLISVVLGSYNRLSFLKLTIASLRRELELCGMKSEIIVVEGGSSDGSLNWLSRQKDIIAIIQHNRGEWNGRQIERRSWGYFMNLGFKCAQGKYICMISDDCLIVPGAILNGVKLFEGKLNSGVKTGGIAFFWREWPSEEAYRIGHTYGDHIFVNHGLYLKEALESVNYIDEENFQFYCADGDLALRMLEQGWNFFYSEHSFIEHYGHANLENRRSNFFKEDMDYYASRWQNKLRYPEIPWVHLKKEDLTRTSRCFLKTRHGMISFVRHKIRTYIVEHQDSLIVKTVLSFKRLLVKPRHN